MDQQLLFFKSVWLYEHHSVECLAGCFVMLACW